MSKLLFRLFIVLQNYNFIKNKCVNYRNLSNTISFSLLSKLHVPKVIGLWIGEGNSCEFQEQKAQVLNGH